MRWLYDISNSMDLGELWEVVRDREELEFCSPCICEESDMTWGLNNNKGR